MSHLLFTAVPFVALYAIFLVWYGGNGHPMEKTEMEGLLQVLEASDSSEHGREALAQVRELMASDDGREFVMLNLVRYRPKALYPPGHNYSDDPREADKRYGKSIMGALLRNGSHPIFIARRSGAFMTPAGADAWHYTAMVRYRSRRDFLRFAIESSRAESFMHKWAAIERTHVFPVRPLVSLVTVRLMVAALFLACGNLLGYFV